MKSFYRVLDFVAQTVENLSKENEEVADIDDALQDELCQLWDMSMNPVSYVPIIVLYLLYYF